MVLNPCQTVSVAAEDDTAQGQVEQDLPGMALDDRGLADPGCRS